MLGVGHLGFGLGEWWLKNWLQISNIWLVLVFQGVGRGFGSHLDSGVAKEW